MCHNGTYCGTGPAVANAASDAARPTFAAVNRRCGSAKAQLKAQCSSRVLSFDADTAEVWGRLHVPHPENPLDKQIAATALIHDVVLVTRNIRHFVVAGVKIINPVSA